MTDTTITHASIQGAIVFSLYTQKVEFISNVKESFFNEPGHWQDNYVFIREETLEIDMNGTFNPINGMVAALETQKVSIQAQATNRITEIDRKINTLLAIENNPTVASAGAATFDDGLPF